HAGATLPGRGVGLRATKRPSHQPLDRTGNCRRNHAAWDYPTDFASSCRTTVKKGARPPHLIRYWLTPPQDEHREGTIKEVCAVYTQAPQLAEQGERTISTDELTGVQALERKHPGLPLAPGKVERREFERSEERRVGKEG